VTRSALRLARRPSEKQLKLADGGGFGAGQNIQTHPTGAHERECVNFLVADGAARSDGLPLTAVPHFNRVLLHLLTELTDLLRQDALFPHPERLVHFFDNHDASRFFTDAGNSMARLKEAIGLAATLRGTPELYSGDKIAMVGGSVPDNRRDFPGGFSSAENPAAPSAFLAGQRTPSQQETFAWTSGLMMLRKNTPALQRGAQQNLHADESAFAFVRADNLAGCSPAHDRASILVALNKSTIDRTIDLHTAGTALLGCTEFSPLAPAGMGSAQASQSAVRLAIPAESFVLFAVR